MRVSYFVFAAALAAAVPACNFEVHDDCWDDDHDDHCHHGSGGTTTTTTSSNSGDNGSSTSTDGGGGSSSNGSSSGSGGSSDTGSDSSSSDGSTSGSGGSAGSASTGSTGGGEAGAGPDTCDDCGDPEPSECLWGETEMSSCCDVLTLAGVAEEGCAAYDLELSAFSLEDACEDEGHTRVRYQCCL